MKSRLINLLYPIAGTAIIVLAWHFYVVLLKVSPVVLPTPWQVAVSMAVNFKILMSEAWVTLLECIYGFVLAMAIGSTVVPKS